MRWAAAATALSAVSGCHGGLTFQGVVLLVTVGIFIGTLFLERSP